MPVSKTIKDLQKLWKEEKEKYKSAEIGTGVQKFVKHIFECEELFGLEEGKLSTPDLKRKKEFITEARKKGRRADMVVFIDSDIIIPVEIEKHGNIKAGEKQIRNYQADWVKKYGILTDGYEWRFYNNSIPEKTFTLDKILENPDAFLVFWKEYITPEYYYRSFFERKAKQYKLFDDEFPSVDKVREDFFLDITTLIQNFYHKLNLKGYFKGIKDEKEREKKAVEITYAYLIQFILYKTLVDNAFGDFENDWKDRIKQIDSAIRSGNYESILVKVKGISQKISKNIYKRFNDEQESINEKLDEILSKPKNNISDVSVWLDILLFIHRYDFGNVKHEIFGYVYENYLKQYYEDEGKKGQYFTDPTVVEFMLNEMGYTKEHLKKSSAKEKNNISIIDPSCGSGTFLYKATHRLLDTFFDGTKNTSQQTENIINENVFGLDIAEFPLYLAEMNILMRMLPLIVAEKYNNPIDKKIKTFKTHDSIAEFLDTPLNNTLTDATVDIKKNKGQISLNLFSEIEEGHESFHRDKTDLEDLKRSLENRNKIPRYRFDYVIGNPPYVGYNECDEQNLLIFQMMRSGNDKRVKLNNIYGVNLHSVPGHPKKGRPNPNLYLFFISLGLALLKDGGKICYIIPQTLFTAANFDVMRYHLAKFTTIEKLFVFNKPLFIGRGIAQENKVPTSSFIFVIKKIPPLPNNKVEVIIQSDVKHEILQSINDIQERRNSISKSISQKELLKNYLNWNYIKSNKKTSGLYERYCSNADNINIYYDHSLAPKYFNSNFYFDGGYDLDESKMLNSPPENDYYVYPKFISSAYTKIIPRGYWPNIRGEKTPHNISLRQGNQGYKLLDSEYKIVWNYTKPNRFYFSNERIIWTRNQFNAIGSDNKQELLYLFSLLNSSFVFKILLEKVESKNEQDYLFALATIRNFVKVPTIDKINIPIKSEIITQTEEMLAMEKQTLNHLVDFENIMLQKFDAVEISDGNFVLHYKDKLVKCCIKSNSSVVYDAIAHLSKKDMFDENEIGNVTELMQLSVYDKNYQTQIKNYIDDLVFALYFKIKLPKLSFENRESIKDSCSKNKFYKLVNL